MIGKLLCSRSFIEKLFVHFNLKTDFPVSLPSWFIKLFTKEGDAVLVPFMGSGIKKWLSV